MLAPSESAVRIQRLMGDGQVRTMADISRETGIGGMPLDTSLNTLVRNRFLRRIHSTDGVMRYRSKEGAGKSKPARDRAYPNTVLESIVAALRAAERPIITDDLMSIAGVSRSRCSTALVRLRDEGLAEPVRLGRRWGWRMTECR